MEEYIYTCLCIVACGVLSLVVVKTIETSEKRIIKELKDTISIECVHP